MRTSSFGFLEELLAIAVGAAFEISSALSSLASPQASWGTISLLLIAVIIVILFFLQKNDIYLFLFLLLIPLTRQIPYNNLVTNVLTASFVFLYVTRRILLRQFTVSKPLPLVVGTIAFYLLVILVSSLCSEYSAIGLTQLGREIGFYIVIYILYDSIRSLSQWRLAVKALNWIGIAASMSIVISFLTSFAMPGARLSGIFTSATAAGLAISVPFPVTLSYLQGQVRLKMPHARIYLVAFVILSLVASVLTVSRITIVGVLLGMLLLWWRALVKNLRPLILVGAVLVLIATPVVLYSSWPQRVAMYLRLYRGLSGRGLLWQRAWDIFTDHPILGSGPSTYRYYVLTPEIEARFGSPEEILDLYAAGELDPAAFYVGLVFGGVVGNSSHNLLLGVLSNTGIIGLASVCLIFLAIWRLSRKQLLLLSEHRYAMPYWIVQGCVWSIIIQLVRVQFEEPGIIRGALSEALPFWLAIVLIAKSSAIWNQERVNLQTEIVQR